MKLYKKILLGFAILVALILIAGVTVVPRHWTVSREITVNAEPAAIYPWLVDIEKWERWNAFSLNDPDIVHTYPGAKTGVGAESRWTSRKFGDGKAKIVKAYPEMGVTFELRFGEREEPAIGSLAFGKLEPGKTTVVYSVSGDNGFNPAYRWMSLFMKGFMCKFFDQSLAKIKELAETNPAPVSVLGDTTMAAGLSQGLPSVVP